MPVSRIVLDTKLLDKMTVQLKPDVQKRIGKSAAHAISNAKQNSPWRYGAHRNSGYFVPPGGNASNRQVQPKNDMSATLGFTMDYSIYLELGTQNKDNSVRMAARPHLVPAVDAEEKPLIADLKAMFRK